MQCLRRLHTVSVLGGARHGGARRSLCTHTPMSDPATARNLVAANDNFIFDCDGVLYTPEGVVEGAVETLAQLRAAGKRCFFVTNNSTATRQQLQVKLKAKGFDAEVDEIFGSAYITACYLRQKAARGEFSGKVYVSGTEPLAEEIRAVGLTVLGGAADNDKLGAYDASQMAAVEVDPEVKAVVVGMDCPGFCFYKVAYSCRCLVENAGCEFISTNPDLRLPMISAKAADPVREGIETSYLPEGGAFAAMVAACVGRQPTVCGKPSPLAMDLICAENQIDKARTVMVGDTLYTDIAFGNTCGVKTVLVLSGNTSIAAAQMAEGDEKPSVILGSVAEMQLTSNQRY